MNPRSTQTQFSKRLRLILDAHHMTQSELARISGVAQTTISNILRGTHAPRADILESLAKALGITVATLAAIPTDDEYPPLGTRQERQLIDAFRACDGEARRVLSSLAELLAARSKGGRN